MSLIYYLIIRELGYFRLGRFVDLIYKDIIIVLLAVIAYCEIRSWVWRRDR